MNAFDLARDLYRDGKQLVDLTRDIAVSNDALRWAREDLEDVLLDLKLAVLNGDSSILKDLGRQVAAIIETIHREING